jgi:hypothetical protein
MSVMSMSWYPVFSMNPITRVPGDVVVLDDVFGLAGRQFELGNVVFGELHRRPSVTVGFTHST